MTHSEYLIKIQFLSLKWLMFCQNWSNRSNRSKHTKMGDEFFKRKFLSEVSEGNEIQCVK